MGENKIHFSADGASASVVMDLTCGGQVVYFLNMIEEEERNRISTFMDECNFFRQYRIGGHNEARVACLTVL